MSKSNKVLYEFDGFRLDPAERLLTRDGIPIPLAPKAFEMLVVLAGNSGRLLSKDELMQAVWTDAVVEENNLDKNISALRKALGGNGAERKLIETVRGHGYRFNAVVKELDAEQRQPITSDNPGSTDQLILPLSMNGSSAARTLPPVEERDKKLLLKVWRHKNALGLVAVLLLTVAGTLRTWPWKERRLESPRGINITRLTNGGYILNAALSPDGKYFAYTEQEGATARLFLRLVAGGQPVVLVPEIEYPIMGLTFAPDGQAIYFVTVAQSNPLGALYRLPVLGGPVTKLLTGITSPVTFSPDGQQMAFIRMAVPPNEGNCLVLANATGGNERVVMMRSGPERFGSNGPSWSPDGKEIACQHLSGLTKTSDEVWRIVGMNLQSGAQRLLTAQPWDGCGRIVWLRDGSGLVLIGTKQGESGTTARDSVWLVSQPDGVVRRITTDLSRHNYGSISVTDDGQSLLVLPFNRTSQIWSVEARGQGEKTRYDAASAVQLTTGTGDGRAGIVSLNDGHIVYVARTGEQVDLWRMNNIGGQQQQLTTSPPFLEEVSAPPDGRFFVFASNHAGYSHLFRVDHDGTNLRQLTSGESREIDSDTSPDGQWIVYSSKANLPGKIGEYKLWKIPAEGGAPLRLTDHDAQSPRFSPDGQWISYIKPEIPGERVFVIPANGGTPLKTFDVPNSAESNVGYRWTPDGQALAFIVKGKTFDNLWLQPLNGRTPRVLTDFNSGEIYNYAFSRDGQRLFLARGYSIRDVLLIREFR